ncbi:MAG: hypothetical protein IJC98_00880 [Clostridia bacterium]|nr:hypothetical protein [Clostridia bacterium]
MAENKLTREDCIQRLKEQYETLQRSHTVRYPRRSDFSEREVVAIKAFLGPWPRALEAAGIKPPRDDDRAARNKEKRIRAKRNRTLVKKRGIQTMLVDPECKNAPSVDGMDEIQKKK